MMRIHLTAPPVEPTDAPTTMQRRRRQRARDGQSSKLPVAKPVVVVMEATVKEAYCRDFQKES
jgi:hypothetical protein